MVVHRLSDSHHIIELRERELTADMEENVGNEFTTVLSERNSN
jgi:hypothetical protein